MYVNHQVRCDYNHNWRFKLDGWLRLNLTFQYIYISINNYYGCYIGNLTVKSFSKLDTPDLVQCGVHSYMISYPIYKNVDIVLHIKCYVTHEIELYFCVIDPNRIVSSLPPKNRKD